jgi:serine/threonine protein phosphatase PrpC
MSTQYKHPIYEGLIIGTGKVQDTPIPKHSLKGEVPVVQDKVYVDNSKKIFAIADGITGSGQKSADVASYIVERFPQELYESAIANKNDYSQIYRDLEYLLSNVHNEMKKKFNATSTLIAGYITPERKLLTYRVGDCECRIIRNNEIFHIDNLLTSVVRNKKSERVSYEPLFFGKYLTPEFERGTRVQAENYEAPNQVGNCTGNGRFTVHQLCDGDRIILSSDGFNKVFKDNIEDKIKHITVNSINPSDAENKLITSATAIGLKDDYSAIVIFNRSPSKKNYKSRIGNFFDKFIGMFKLNRNN